MAIVGAVLAAGASTRMKSEKSKLLHSVAGQTLIERAHRLVSEITGETPILVLGHQQEAIESHLQRQNLSFRAVRQDPPRGTGDAVMKALSHLEDFSEPDTHIFIMAGDAILLKPQTLKAFCEEHQRAEASMSLISFEVGEENAYGRIVRASSGQVERIVEFKNASEDEKRIKELNSGFYLIRLASLKSALGHLQSNSLTGEIYLTDLVEVLANQGQRVQAIPLKEASECLGVNTQNDLATVRQVMRDRINSRWMNEGVEMEDPLTTWIDENVRLSPNVVMGSNVHLRGECKIESGVEIESFCEISDSVVSSGTKIFSHSRLESVVVGRDCQIGPYARLRPETVLKDKVKVGNFVETKKSVFETQSKANHLSYVGDASVGEGCNIGAGTITCNYDGFKKHQTRLGKDVFIGSNTALVAPVDVGDGALVAAGSVVSKNVSPQSIAICRAEQREIPGAAQRYREKKRG